MAKHIIKISQEGTLTFLYSDSHPCLSVPGDISINRASNVHFDNDCKLWFVHEIKSDGSEVKHPEGFKFRADAIAYEVGILEKQLG